MSDSHSKLKILVTGSKGFVGSHLVEYLKNAGYDVFGIDLLDGIDIRNLSVLNSIFRSVKPDGVVHLAAVSRTPHANEDPIYTYETNILGSANVLEAAKMAKVKKVILASSNIVYGVDNAYKVSKLAMEKIAHVYDVAGVPAICLRFANIAGESQHPDNFLMALSQSKKKNGYVTIFGSGEQERDIIYVGDVCRAIDLAITAHVRDTVIDICTGKMHKLIDIAKMFDCQIKFAKERENDTKVLLMQGPTMAEILIGFKAEKRLEDFISIYT